MRVRLLLVIMIALLAIFVPYWVGSSVLNSRFAAANWGVGLVLTFCGSMVLIFIVAVVVPELIDLVKWIKNGNKNKEE